MPVSAVEARQRLLTLLDGGPCVVNVHGPLGVGKTHLLSAVRSERAAIAPLVIDGVDTDRRARSALGLVRAAGAAPVIVAGRRPLAHRVDLPEPVETIELAPWSPADIATLCPTPGAVDFAVRLAGGIPLIAAALGRAIRLGTGPDATGALADHAATAVLRRLATESGDLRTVREVAALDGVDEDLLALLVRRPAVAFGRLRRLSVVADDHHGLSVREPYRTVFDLAYQWRNPLTRADLAEQATTLRFRQLVTVAEPPRRARIADQIIHLSGHHSVQHDIFATTRSGVTIRPAGPDDATTMGQLIRRWADEEGLDRRRAERMLGLWLDGPDHGFALAVDAVGQPLGMVNLSPLGPGGPALDPLLQQHAATLAGAAGLVVGMMTTVASAAWAQPAMVRHILGGAMTSGRLVISTPWDPYQRMAARFGFRRLGQTRDDVYRCGRPSTVYAQVFTPESIPDWLRRIQGDPGRPPHDHIRALLRDLRAPVRPGAAVAGLDRLVTAIETLARSGDEVDADAAEILTLYYRRRGAGHDALARRLHLTRATYFRRLEHGIRRLAELLPDEDEP